MGNPILPAGKEKSLACRNRIIKLKASVLRAVPLKAAWLAGYPVKPRRSWGPDARVRALPQWQPRETGVPPVFGKEQPPSAMPGRPFLITGRPLLSLPLHIMSLLNGEVLAQVEKKPAEEGISVGRERLQDAVREAAPGGRLPCARALQLARELGVSPARVGEVADELGVKIVSCQLGCFR